MSKKVFNNALNLYMSEASKYKRLTDKEEIELGKKVKYNDIEAISKLVNHNLRLAVSIAQDFKNLGMDFEDIVQNANLGLINAAKKFDYTKGVKFSTYATYWIKQYILRENANTADTIRRPVHVCSKISKLKRLKEINPSITDKEIMEKLKIKENELILLNKYQFDYISMQNSVTEDDDVFLQDIIEDKNKNIENIILDNIFKNDIIKSLDVLTDKEKDILVLNYGLFGYDSYKLEDVARILNMTYNQVRVAKAKALRTIRKGNNIDLLKSYLDENVVHKEKRVRSNSLTIYDLLSDITLDKNKIDNAINELDDHDKTIIDILYGDDLMCPKKDISRYNSDIYQEFYYKVLVKLKKRVIVDKEIKIKKLERK